LETLFGKSRWPEKLLLQAKDQENQRDKKQRACKGSTWKRNKLNMVLPRTFQGALEQDERKKRQKVVLA
jgi:hypothetical protein